MEYRISIWWNLEPPFLSKEIQYQHISGFLSFSTSGPKRKHNVRANLGFFRLLLHDFQVRKILIIYSENTCMCFWVNSYKLLWHTFSIEMKCHSCVLVYVKIQIHILLHQWNSIMIVTILRIYSIFFIDLEKTMEK